MAPSSAPSELDLVALLLTADCEEPSATVGRICRWPELASSPPGELAARALVIAAAEGRGLDLADLDGAADDLAVGRDSDAFDAGAGLAGLPYSRRYDAYLDVPTWLAVELSPM